MRQISQLLALLFVLQNVAIGVACQTAATHTATAGGIAQASSDCTQNAGENERTPPPNAHPNCYIFCSANCGDKLAFPRFILVARAEFLAPTTYTTSGARAEADPLEQRSTWAGASSSRGPPRFS